MNNHPSNSSGKSEKKKNQLSHHEFAAQCVWATTNKATIQASLDSGKTLAAFAKDRNLAPSTTANVFRFAGLEYRGNRTTPPDNNLRIAALLAVVARIAKELNVSCEEITPYLP
jgi:hypothetical protein